MDQPRYSTMIVYLVIFALAVVAVSNILGETNKDSGNDLSIGDDFLKLSQMEAFKNNISDQIKTGQVSFVEKVTIFFSTSYTIGKTMTLSIWDFIVGNNINKLVVDYMRLPEEVAVAVQIIIIFLVALAFIAIILNRDKT